MPQIVHRIIQPIVIITDVSTNKIFYRMDILVNRQTQATYLRRDYFLRSSIYINCIDNWTLDVKLMTNRYTVKMPYLLKENYTTHTVWFSILSGH